ncbi:MAG: hypothetical protein NXI23_09035 [Bacteroidetes bacterium]|jgi:hypothetical protein|nr:hypothetical protein [Bacteroidota bacterium]MDF1865321.1 hypothetical protein [Saprospiraceae bacterium]
MYWKPTFIMFSLIFALSTVVAQTDGLMKVLDEIHLKNGSTFKGEIVSYKRGKIMKIKLQTGQEIEIQDSEIQKIVQGIRVNEENIELTPKEAKKPIVLRTSGVYNTTYTSFASGNNRFDQFTLGAGVHNVTGMHWTPKIGVGIGIGLDNYSRRGETILPIYAEFKFIPIEKAKELFLVASAGWGFAFKREQFGIIDAKGGYMFHPAIGYRAGTSDGTNVVIDLGIKFQDAFFKEELPNNDLEFRDIVFKRVVIRVGLTLWN